MKVTLLSFNTRKLRYSTNGNFPPLGIAYIAAYLIKDGFDVSIIDFSLKKFSYSVIKNNLINEKADIIGISSTLFGISDAVLISKIIKEINDKTIVVLGGPVTSFSPEAVLKRVETIDIILKGAGELTMPLLCKFVKEKKDIGMIKGIYFRRDNKIFINRNIMFISNMNSMPFPARELLENKKYHLHPPFGLKKNIATLETSRGCPFNCNFCTNINRAYLYRDAEKIFYEIELLKDIYHVEEIYIVDPSFTVQRENIKKLCRLLINNNNKIIWSCKSRVDTVDEELLFLMKEAGCYSISYGIESGEQKILANINKFSKLKEIEDALLLTNKAGIRSIGYFMAGNPGETDDTINKTISLIKNNKLDFIMVNGFFILPGTDIFKIAVKKNIIEKDYFIEYFNQNLELKFPLFLDTEKNYEKINNWIKKIYINFYLSPLYIIKLVFQLKSLFQIKMLIYGFFSLLHSLLCFKNTNKFIESKYKFSFFKRH